MKARYSYVSFILFVCFVALLTSCKHLENEQVNKVTAELEKKLEVAKKEVSALTAQGQSLTTEELEKLFVFEYEVIDIPSSATRHEVQETLVGRGRDRWEAFFVDTQSDTIRVYFRRRPKSYLRYIPRFFP